MSVGVVSRESEVVTTPAVHRAWQMRNHALHTRGSVSRRVGIQGYQMAIVIWMALLLGFPRIRRGQEGTMKGSAAVMHAVEPRGKGSVRAAGREERHRLRQEGSGNAR